MKVTVLQRPKWGTPNAFPQSVTVEIADTCPQCGGPRGEPRWGNMPEDGVWYPVQLWDNPCGHVDLYTDVLKEARP